MQVFYKLILLIFGLYSTLHAEPLKPPFQTPYTILESADKVLDTQSKDFTVESGRTVFKPKANIASGVTLTVEGTLLSSDVISGLGTLSGTGTVARVDKQTSFDDHVTFNGDVSIVGTLFGGSPLKIGSPLQLSAGAGILGVTDGSAASTGEIGELLEDSDDGGGSGIDLAQSVWGELCSLTLTAGDWDVWGQVHFNASGATIERFQITISDVSAAVPTDQVLGKNLLNWAVGSGLNSGGATLRNRINLSSTDTYYLNARPLDADPTNGFYCYFAASRVR